ncbi:MAG: hypothetical protein HY685_04385 [Chloroflexi bacterium]|nr:hypothetical protein [Chloroflexota bacterium]
MRKLVLALVLAGALLAATAAPALAHDMTLTLSDGTCVVVPDAAGNPGPGPNPSGLSLANPLTDAIVSVVHDGGSC